MAAHPKLPSNYQIKDMDADATTNSKELRISNLYLHHACCEPSSTHPAILSPDGHPGFRAAECNVSAIYNGPDPKADDIVAYVHGLHIQCGQWHNSFTVAFEIDGLKDSTLQVMGTGDQNSDYWSIAGGTGQFTLAQGLIYRRNHKATDTMNIIELDIYAIFRPTKIIIRDGPKPSGAKNHEPTYEPRRLESIKIGHSDWICAVEYTYEDKTGRKYTESLHGYTKYSNSDTVQLGPTEFVKEISASVGNYAQYVCLTSIMIVTNLRTLGPFGKPTEDTFSLPEKKGGSVVGFIGWAGAVVDTIGVIVNL